MTLVPRPLAIDRPAMVGAAAHYVGEWIMHQMSLRGLPGVQVAIRFDGELVLDLAVGHADVVAGTPLTGDHLFRIASHTKTMTATAIFQLRQEGLLALDDPIDRWLPELHDSALARVTIRELLGHQGGIIRDGVDADYWQHGAAFPDRDLLLALTRKHGRVQAANEHFKYSNVGYGLLGQVIEAASGLPFDGYLRTHVWQPLGLAHTGADWDPGRADDYVSGHTAALTPTDVRRAISHGPTGALASATGAYSSAVELTAYFDAHRMGDDRLLTDESKRLMRRTESRLIVDGSAREYGLGVELLDLDGTRLIGHSGGYPGQRSRSWLDDDTGLVVSVLANSTDTPVDALALGAVRIIRAALSHAAGQGNGIDPDTELVPAGRYANLWSVTDVVRWGRSTFIVSPSELNPVDSAVRVVDVDGVMRTAAVSGFTAVDEPVQVRRTAAGAVESIVVGGVTMWPLDAFRDAMRSPDPARVLVRMSL